MAINAHNDAIEIRLDKGRRLLETNQAIAGQLWMSTKTVETHVGSIFAKLGLAPAAEDHRRVLAVLAFLRC